MSTERTNAIPAPPSTAKTLVFPAVQVERPRFVPPRPPRLRNLTRAPSSSDTGVIELSASALEEILDDAMTPAPPKVAWPARALGRVADALRDRAARDEASRNARALERSIAASSVPPPSNAKPAFDDAWGAAAIAKLPRFVLGAAFVRGTAGPIAFALLAGALVEGSVQTAAARPEPHAAAFVHATLAHPRDGAFVDAPSGGCVALAPAKAIAPRAQLGPGVDVTVLDDGFGLAFAASASDAEVVRVAGPWLRVEERVHEHGAWGLRHVAAGEDDDALAVRVDAGDARTIVKAGGAPLRVSALGGWIGVTPADGRLRALWTLPPGGPMMPASFGFSRGSRSTQRARLVPAPESVRAAVRDDGALAVALKRTGAIWTGVTDAKLSASGPLVAIDRRGATLGAPSIATARDGAIVVWSERAEGAAEWSVVVAAVSGGAVTTHVVGAGMSPSIVALADGDLVVAYAVGASGAHRVVAQRLAPSLEPRGEAVPISPGEMNAGQPAVAVAADGRGVVAFFVADAHDRGALHATPLACAVR